MLSQQLMGVYLQGSFAIGDFDENSDADFLVLLHSPLSAEQVEQLNDMHRAIFALGGWGEHLEGSYFTREIFVKPPTGDRVWYLDHGHQTLCLSDHCNTLVVRHTLQTAGITLYGEPPQQWMEPVPSEALRQEIYGVIQEWGATLLEQPDAYANRFYQGFILINYCRMLHDFKRATVSSKRHGAAWAKANLDPKWRPWIDRAWGTRPDPAKQVRTPADPEAYAMTLEFVREVMAVTKREFKRKM